MKSSGTEALSSSVGSFAHNPIWQSLHSKHLDRRGYKEENGQETLGSAPKVCHKEFFPEFNHMSIPRYKRS